MKIFKSNKEESKAIGIRQQLKSLPAMVALIDLLNALYDAMALLIKARNEGDPEAARAASAKMRDLQHPRAAAEVAADNAIRAALGDLRPEIKKLDQECACQEKKMRHRAAMHAELAAQFFEACALGSVAEKIRNSLELPYDLQNITEDEHKELRRIGKELARAELEKQPGLFLAESRQELAMLKNILEGSGYAVASLRRRIINDAVLSGGGMDAMRGRVDLERRVAALS